MRCLESCKETVMIAREIAQKVIAELPEKATMDDI
jgi:hypothetical protein